MIKLKWGSLLNATRHRCNMNDIVRYGHAVALILNYPFLIVLLTGSLSVVYLLVRLEFVQLIVKKFGESFILIKKLYI